MLSHHSLVRLIRGSFASRACASVAAALLSLPLPSAVAGDLADSADLEFRRELDLGGLYAFPGSTEDRIVLVMTLNSPIVPADAATARFDSTGLYQFKIDNTGDAVEDIVIQFRFQDLPGGAQSVAMYGPSAGVPGRINPVIKPQADLAGNNNSELTKGDGAARIQLFAGLRDEPFFIDLDQLYRILPDRRPSRGPLAEIGPAPEASAFRPACTNGNPNPGQAQFDQTHGCAENYLRNRDSLAIVVELPESAVKAAADTIRVWATSSRRGQDQNSFLQVDRTGNPLVSTLFVEKREHGHFNVSVPSEDVAQFRDDIARFMTSVAGRAPAYANAVAAAFTPDMLTVRLDKNGGGPFGEKVGWLSHVLDPANGYGGRKVQGDDAVDKMLSVVFGNAFGNNNNVSPGLVTDNVGANDKLASSTFPYLPSGSGTPTSPIPAQLLNIATRGFVQPGEKAMIAGFIVTGTESKRVLFRGIGPSIKSDQIPEVLEDPVMELHGPDGSLIIANDNWRDTQQAEIEATGLQPQNDLEPAVIATLGPEAYTAVILGKDETSGVAVAEGYDLAQPAASQLANISTRLFVLPGEKVLIAGFFLGNNVGSGRLLIRGLGPSLSNKGVNDVLADPTLELYDGNAMLIRTNDNWGEVAGDRAAIEATGIPPEAESESAIIATLPPGQYTAILADKDGGQGVGLVELYRLQ